MGLSFLFHLAVFSTILFLPQSTPTARPLEGMVYEVNLVEMPAGGQSKAKSAGIKKKSKGKAAVKKSKRAKKMFDEMHEVKSKGIQRRVSRLAPYLKAKEK